MIPVKYQRIYNYFASVDDLTTRKRLLRALLLILRQFSRNHLTPRAAYELTCLAYWGEFTTQSELIQLFDDYQRQQKSRPRYANSYNKNKIYN